MTPLAVSAFTATTACGVGRAALSAALQEGRSGLAPNNLHWAPLACWIGRVRKAENMPLPPAHADFDCRNHRLARLALEQDGFGEAVAAARERHGAARIGLFLGTSTSGIRSTEIAYLQRDARGELPAWFRYDGMHNLDATGEFVRRWLQLEGPAMTLSTACSSSAKVFCLAERFIRLGLIDAAVVGGVDSLCLTTLYGFNSLQLVSPEVCRPFDAARRGLSIGEAAGFALLERVALLERDAPQAARLRLLGYGETSDAHHMSTPHPEGEGAARAMREALARAGLQAGDIGYVNLHGTATPANDRAEGKAMQAVFGEGKPCSSTKGHTGHTLGAAGITEAVVSLLALEGQFLPGSPTTREVEAGLGCAIVLQPRAASLDGVMSNSFGFGGSNCALIFGRTP